MDAVPLHSRQCPIMPAQPLDTLRLIGSRALPPASESEAGQSRSHLASGTVQCKAAQQQSAHGGTVGWKRISQTRTSVMWS